MKNLKLFTQELLIETASLFPELRVLKYLPSKNAVKEEWKGVFDTYTLTFLKEFWELVNNEEGPHSVLFSERISENKLSHEMFSLKQFAFNFIESSKRLDKTNEKYDFPGIYVSSDRHLGLSRSLLTKLNCHISKGNQMYILIFDYETLSHRKQKHNKYTNEELYDEIFHQIKMIDVLSSLTNKYTFVNSVKYIKYTDDDAYLRFHIELELDLDINLYKYDRRKVENFTSTAARKHEEIIFEKVKLELEKKGFQF